MFDIKMPIVSRIVSLFRSLFGRARLDRELDEELAGYLEERVEQRIRQGRPPEAARREALSELEGFEQVKEEVRAARIGSGVEGLLRDLRYGWRSLRGAPGFTAAAVVTLSLGIGASTAIFSVVHAVLLRPLPFDDPERIVTLWQKDLANQVDRDDVSVANFLDWRERSTVFEEIALSEPYGYSYFVDGRPVEIHAQRVSEGYFRALGVPALLGRTFHAEEYRRNAGPEFRASNEGVCVLSHALWRRTFGGDPDVVGRTLQLDDRPITVVGVMPPEFRPNLYATARASPQRDLFTPRSYRRGESRNRANYRKAVARLKPGVTAAEARAELKTIAAQLRDEFPETNDGVGVSVVPIRDHLQGRIRPALWVLFGAVGLVLLIACANVANLQLVRGERRAQELAVRAAIGAGRARLLRQLLVESAVLGLVGCVGGLAVALGAVRWIIALRPSDVMRLDQAELSLPVLAFALTTSFATVLIFGLLPALRQSRVELHSALSRRTADPGSARAQRAVIAAQVAFALPLLVGAALLTRSFWGLIQVDPGYAKENVVALQVHVWGKVRGPQQRLAYFSEALERIRAAPGVEYAGISTTLPLFEPSIDVETQLEIAGSPSAPGREPVAEWTTATTGYFRALGMELLRGRLFEPSDDGDGRRVAVINQTMATRFWPDQPAIGGRFRFEDNGRALEHEVVGVVADLLHYGADSAPKPEFFVPYAQNPDGSMTFVVRSSVEPTATLRAVEASLFEVRKDVPVYLRVVLSDLVTESTATRRFGLFLLASLAVLALALTAIGLYGVVSFFVAQRTKEIGLRMAFGAEARDIGRMVARQGLGAVAAGGAVGLTAALGLRRSIESLLFGVEPFDPVSYGAVVVLLAGTAWLACRAPAARAAALSPMDALRRD